MADIIKTTVYSDSIINLWREAFGDSREEVEFFLNRCKNKACLCLKENDTLLSMLFLVDCQIDGESYKYIYAVSTPEKYRKNGYSTKLLTYCLNKYKNLVLIPGDNSLAEFYINRGFKNKIDTHKITFNECEEITEYLFEGCNLKKPFALSNRGE